MKIYLCLTKFCYKKVHLKIKTAGYGDLTFPSICGQLRLIFSISPRVTALRCSCSLKGVARFSFIYLTKATGDGEHIVPNQVLLYFLL